MSPESDTDTSQVEGNASPEIKRAMQERMQFLRTKQFSQLTGEEVRVVETAFSTRLRLVEVSILPKAEEPEKLEGRVVFEVTADEYMVNQMEQLHGGCTAWLIDDCSTMPVYVLGLATIPGYTGKGGLSQALNVVYHSPALLGDKLRIVSTTLAAGSRTFSSRCEIWNTTRHRLVASAVHLKMEPRAAKAPAKL
ncbi:hypothetical protein M405DRAFT_809819 [Rhizopogon salebrosus TDB-379]|nr:hypothetical protein M405DRAFT_809819 [Rhizopogon salebrosus TDB-379]